MNRDAVIDLVSQVTEMNDLSAFMQDEDLDMAMAYVIKMITKPEPESMATAPKVVVKLQALSAKFAIMARYYTTFEKGPEASKKKNVYYTMAEEIDKLAAAVKYLSR
jgi:hypothetical protein